MNDIRYNEAHVWASIDDYGTVLIGVSEYAQEQLGDIVYVELPEVGQDVSAGDEIAVIESVKTTSEIAAPVTGTIYMINEDLAERPELINESPLEEGWLFRIEPGDIDEQSELMSEADYTRFVEEEA
ncbi:MAG: glycine cleavage system H protein [Gammaproteobacteria bacterium]|jgi:glycine cleavage system H protein